VRYIDKGTEVLQFPEASLSGDAAVNVGLLDTGWDINWPGPGHVYLSDRDIVDILIAAKDAELVVDALKLNGWTAPGETDARVAELEAQNAELADALAEAKIAEAGFDAAAKKLEAKKPAAVHTSSGKPKTAKE
jgi:hypothetical protein